MAEKFPLHDDSATAEDRLIPAILDRNIGALLKRRSDDAERLRLQDRIAGRITAFAGSMIFVYAHAVVFGLWIAINLGWLPLLPAFDPTLVILAMVASVEAIFLSTFVLISQNRMARDDDKRADLSLQIALLNEHETTKLIEMVSAIAEKLDAGTGIDPAELTEMKRNVPPEAVLEEIERRKSE